ncbi:MAG: hypothetical protein KKE30_04590 [Gammaproteobacteria bacterium]|nr:hypothetical protein [Gammaproteobacteria bacterium]
MKKLILIVVAAFLLSGCAVGMALSGKETKSMSALQIGQSRDIVLLNLGQPAGTTAAENGRVDRFELQRGNDPSLGRALFHGAMDFLTWGAWEVIGTPMEGMQGKSFIVTVEYDKNDKVIKVNSTDKE